jgi:hypothetical protein
MFKNVVLRIFAVFAYSAMAIIGGASMLGDIPVWKAAVLAGISATAQVMERLARAFADDGHLDVDEINEAFTGHRIDSAE